MDFKGYDKINSLEDAANLLKNNPASNEFEANRIRAGIAQRLTSLAQQAENAKAFAKASDLDSEAASIARDLGMSGGNNPFSEQKDPMLHRQFRKGVSDTMFLEDQKHREKSQQPPPNAVKAFELSSGVGALDSTISDETYKSVREDLNRLSKTLKNDDKAIKAGALSDQLAKYSEARPAPKKLQEQIQSYEKQRRDLIIKLAKNVEKETGELSV